MKLLSTLTAIGLATFAVSDNAAAAPSDMLAQFAPQRIGGLKPGSKFSLKIKVADNPQYVKPYWYQEQTILFKIGKRGELVVGGVATQLLSSSDTVNIYAADRRMLTLRKKGGKVMSVEIQTSFLYDPGWDTLGRWKTGHTYYFMKRK